MQINKKTLSKKIYFSANIALPNYPYPYGFSNKF